VTTTPFKVGDWVTITGRIVEFHPNTVDLGVEVFSKTDQYVAFARRDLCAPTTKPIPDEPGEGSVALLSRRAWQRLGDDHWYAVDIGVGARLTWAELQMRGDVEVIHHA
jgi:hypothetical protein